MATDAPTRDEWLCALSLAATVAGVVAWKGNDERRHGVRNELRRRRRNRHGVTLSGVDVGGFVKQNKLLVASGALAAGGLGLFLKLKLGSPAAAYDVSGTVKLVKGIPAGSIVSTTPVAAVAAALVAAKAAGKTALPIYNNANASGADTVTPVGMLDTTTGQQRALTDAERAKAIGF